MKKSIISLIILLISISYSQTIVGDGLTGQPLLDYVVSNYKTSTTLGYTDARDILYGTIDLKDGNQLSGVYTGYTITLDPLLDPSTDAYNQGINCEHTWPQSMGAGNEPQKSDMHHLFPCKSNVNSSRGNDPYAEIPDIETDTWYRNDYSQETIPTEYIDEFAEKYNPPNADYETFEPREDHKGDAARAVFYFFCMYNDVADTNFWNEQKDYLIDWHYYDEVDTWELDRTWTIASYQQDQPNPFILDSSLARRIWYMEDSGTDTSTIDTLEYNLVINEIMQNPSAVSDANGEWFEIFNFSPDTINLSGFTIKDNGSNTHTISSSVTILPYFYAVLAKNADINTNGGLSVDYEYSDFTLGNSDDEIVLIDPYGNTIDSVAYDGGPNWPDPTGATMALFGFETDDNNLGYNWVESDSLTYGDGDYGTPGYTNNPVEVIWTFSLSNPVITILGDNDELNPGDTATIKMELCNETNYDYLLYPGAVLDVDTNLVSNSDQNWYYALFANQCGDSLTWNIVANADITENTQVDFMAYPSSLSCESLPAYCVVGDTINFSMDIVVNEPCDTGFVQIGDSCYWEADIAVLQSFIDNSQSSSNPPPLDLSPIELGYQEWDNGRLIKLCVSQSNDGCGSYVIAGNLPENISDLSHLNELNLQNNELYGSIPPAIVNMISLKILSLSNNQFTGSIPSDIGSLTNLENLHLNDNELSGLIPESFCELTIMVSPIFIDWVNFSYLYENNLCFPHPNCIAGLVGSQDTSDCEPLGLADFQIPSQYSLHQNYPNPFNPVTTIQYELPKDSFVNIHIYDLNGRLVNTLISQIQAPGYKAINWNGVDSNGKTVSAGLYLYEIQAGDFRQVRKMVLLK